jgi:hypothetical protein
MASRNGIGVVLLAIGAVACLAGAAYWWLGPDRRWFYTDDGAVPSTLDGAVPRDVMWRPPESLGRGVNSDLDEADPEVAPSGEAVYFTRLAPGGDADLFVAVRSGDGWGEARRLPINTDDNELAPALSPDGAWLYFASDRPGSIGGFDLWRAPVAGGLVGAPEPLGPAVNSPRDDVAPAVVDGDGGPVLYFCSDRADADGEERGFDLFSSRAGSGAESWVGATRLATLSSDVDDLAPAVSPAGDFLYFSSDRPGGAGGFDLYRARLTGGGPGEPRPLGSEINTPADELEPGLAMEGFALYFASDRAGAAGRTDLYRAISREVFVSRTTRGTLADLLALLPWILSALALVLVLTLLSRLVGDVAWRGRLSTLGLMARCVLLSLVAHGALMAILAAMHVPPTSLAGPSEDGSVRVSLASSGVRASVASQMRGSPAPVQVAPAEVAPAQVSANAVPALAPSAATIEPVAAAIERDRVSASRSERSPAPRPEHSHLANEALVGVAEPSARATASLSTPRAAPARRVAERESSLAAAETEASALPDLPRRVDAGATPTERFEPAETGTLVSADRIEPGASSPRAVANDPATPSIESPAEGIQIVGESSLAFVTAPRSDPGGEEAAEPSSEIAPAIAGVVEGKGAGSPRLPGNPAPAPIGFSIARSLSRSPTDTIAPGPGLAAPATEVDDADPGLAPDLPGVETNTLSVLDSPGAAPRAGTGVEEAEVAIEVAEAFGDLLSMRPAESGVTAGVAVDLDPATRERRPGPDLFDLPRTISDAAPGGIADTPSTELPDLDPLGGLAFAIPVTESRPRITGRVVDAETGEPIPHAVVRLDQEKQADVVVDATGDGDFVVEFGAIPENAALAAAHPGYSPGAVNIARAEIERGEHVRIELTPVDPDIIAFERTPEVHHLGNDEYSGRINSQFQREAEGTRIRMPFRIPPGRLAEGVGAAELRLMTKGSQLENQVLLNGRRIGVLAESPGDGSFGEQSVSVPTGLLLPDENVLELRSVQRRNTDIDDFEFVNVRLALDPEERLASLRLSGLVVDESTGAPIEGAAVRLDRIGAAPLEATSDDTGAFVIRADDLPEYAAVVARRDGYEPTAVGVARDRIGERLLLRLTPASVRRIALEETPAVHHLGDDAYSGRVNSRFQRASEGLELSVPFEVRGAVLRRTSRVELRLLAKGLQTSPPVFVNGTPVARLEHAPADGRFGEQRIPIPLGALRPGANTVTLRSVRERADHDDYEFVNMRIVLVRDGRTAY